MKTALSAEHDTASAPQEERISNKPSPRLQRRINESPRQQAQQQKLAQLRDAPVQHNPNGLPPSLRAGIESLSGMDMGGVTVHRNSARPAQLNALAYAQGNEIHLGPGHDKHLPHEAWHVVQQKQGRVRPTLQLKGGVGISTDAGLEKEADVMGAKALATAMTQLKYGNDSGAAGSNRQHVAVDSERTIQRVIGFEYDDDTGAELRDNLELDAEQVYLKLTTACRIRKPAKLREYLAGNDKVGAIFSDTAELIEILASLGLVEPGLTGKFMASAKVGLELTFNSVKSAELIKNDGFPTGKKAEAVKWWNDELSAWTNGLEHEDYVDEYGLEIDIDKGHSQKDLGGGTGDMQNWRVIYKDSDQGVVWWWQLSMDPGVIEIQAAPASGADFTNGVIGKIVGTIYNRASIRKFKAGGGGGHINVDFKTGFDEDPSLIPKILLATEIIIGKLKDSRDNATAKLIDFENELEDPFVGTKRVKMRVNRDGGWDPSHLPGFDDERSYQSEWVRDVMERSGARVANMVKLKEFRDAHAKWLHMHPTLSQQKGATERTGKLSERGDEEGMRAVLHYQAVNIDHLFEEINSESEDAIPEDPRRLEFRFFKGQDGIDEIIACIETIESIVNEAKRLRI